MIRRLLFLKGKYRILSLRAAAMALMLLGSLSFPAAVFSQSGRDGIVIPEGWGRDPFLRAEAEDNDAVAVHGGDETFVLTGILRKEGSRIAIINRVLVREGDMVYDARVAKIEKNSVTLIQDGQEIVLRMGGK